MYLSERLNWYTFRGGVHRTHSIRMHPESLNGYKRSKFKGSLSGCQFLCTCGVCLLLLFHEFPILVRRTQHPVFIRIALHQDVRVYDPYPVLHFLDEPILLQLFHRDRYCLPAAACIFHDLIIRADEQVVARPGVLDDVGKDIELFTVEGSQHCDQFFQITFPETF